MSITTVSCSRQSFKIFYGISSDIFNLFLDSLNCRCKNKFLIEKLKKNFDKKTTEEILEKVKLCIHVKNKLTEMIHKVEIKKKIPTQLKCTGNNYFSECLVSFCSFQN